MKKLGLLLLISVFFIACSDNDVKPPKLKDQIASDLRNTVWTPDRVELLEGDEIEGTVVENEMAEIKSVRFVDNVLECTNKDGVSTRLGYDVSNANKADEIPDIITLNVKSTYPYFYIFLDKNYSSFELQIKADKTSAFHQKAFYTKKN